MNVRVGLASAVAVGAMLLGWPIVAAGALANPPEGGAVTTSANAATGTANLPVASTGAGARSTTRTPIVTRGAWPTYHRDNARTGSDPTLPLVTNAKAGWVSAVLDEQVYASPLVYGGIVYATTLNNTVYALNQIDGSPIWNTHLRPPETSGWSCGNVSPQGILGTPVVDPATGRIYVTTLDGTDDHYRVEGLNLSTGVEELNTDISAFIGGAFDWTIQQERGALVVANGNVYVSFGGRAGDCGSYHGWVFAVPTDGSAIAHYYVTPGIGAGFWNAGGAVVDNSTGKVFVTSGNGTGSGCNNTGPAPTFENDAVVRLSSTLAHEDSFVPTDWQANWCQNDMDLGSTTSVLISPNLMFQSGKWGTGFLLNPANLGGLGHQVFPAPLPAPYSEVDTCLGNHSDATFGSYAYAAPYVYIECEGRGIVALNVNTGAPSFTACSASCPPPNWRAGAGLTFGPPIVAAGAVWAATSGGGLYAFSASTGAQIYHSAGFGINRFVTPAEAGGQVFVPSGTVIRSFVIGFGASQSSPAPLPGRVPAAQAGALPGSGRNGANQAPIAPPPFR